MQAGFVFITGSDTGVGKTALVALLVQELQRRGLHALAVKPLSSGGRGDARRLRAVMGASTTLDAINPWHFRAPLAPLVAARRERRSIRAGPVLKFLRAARRRCDILLIEGAGGLLTPLGEGFDARDLIHALEGIPIVVVPNRLGAINQTLLVLHALGRSAPEARVALMAPARRTVVTRTNLEELRGRLGAQCVIEVPRATLPVGRRMPARLTRALGALMGSIAAPKD